MLRGISEETWTAAVAAVGSPESVATSIAATLREALEASDDPARWRRKLLVVATLAAAAAEAAMLAGLEEGGEFVEAADPAKLARLEALVFALWDGAILSEGQVAAALGIDRVAARGMRQAAWQARPVASVPRVVRETVGRLRYTVDGVTLAPPDGSASLDINDLYGALLTHEDGDDGEIADGEQVQIILSTMAREPAPLRRPREVRHVTRFSAEAMDSHGALALYPTDDASRGLLAMIAGAGSADVLVSPAPVVEVAHG